MPFLPIRSDLFPNLYDSVSNHKIEWNYGNMYSVQISAPIIKINKDRIQWYEYGTFHPSRLWSTMQCEPTRDAFCSIIQESPHPASVLVFPSGTVDVPVDLEQLRFPREFSTFIASNNGSLQCNSRTSNRMLSYTDNRYELSMCDLVDGNLEFVLEPDKNLLYIRQRHTNVLSMVVLSILSLYMFVRTCEHFIKLTHGRRPRFAHGSITLPFLVALFSLSKLILTPSVLILKEEITLQTVLCCYTLIHTASHLLPRLKTAGGVVEACGVHDIQEDGGFFSETGAAAVGPLIAAQTILSLELNETIDTPFLSMFVALFGLRNFLKFLNLVRLHYRQYPACKTQTIRKTIESIADTFIFACLVSIGMKVAAESREQYASNVMVVLMISILAGTLMHSITLLYLP